MSSNKLNNLKLSLLLKELTLLEGEEQYNKEFIDYYKPLFMQEVIELDGEIPPQTGETENHERKKEKKFEVSDEEQTKIKNVFRNIAKVCHPDKTDDPYLHGIYSNAQTAYDQNDLLTLYKISQTLNIEVDIDKENIFLLQRIVDEKKQELKSVEGSYLWLWVNAKTEEEKINLIKQFTGN
jgi:hypothetical protein